MTKKIYCKQNQISFFQQLFIFSVLLDLLLTGVILCFAKSRQYGVWNFNRDQYRSIPEYIFGFSISSYKYIYVAMWF